jgi:pilus assembly protein CpaC
MIRMTKMPPRTLLGAIALSCAFVGSGLPATPAAAQSLASETAVRQTIYVPRDKSLSFRLPDNASKIVVAQPEIAKVTPTTDSSFYVQGIEFGSTNLLVYGPGGRLQQVIDVRVGYDAEGLQQDLVAAFPGEPIEVRNLGESLMLTGDITSTGVQASAEKIAERYAPEAVISRLTVKASQQVILEVRILEASRSALQDIGVNLSVFNQSFAVLSGQGLLGVTSPASSVTMRGGSGSTTIDSQLQLLEEKGIVRTLAKPNLVAVSGEKASFLAGGEFPFPVPDGRDRITVQFRQYGVKLNFLPVVRDNGWIRMLVEPEVSQLDPNNSLTVDGLTVPALSVRRVSTTLELKPGDTFSMAGLYQRSYQNDSQQTPWLADVPVLGALFRSARWKRAETELLILVTPRLANAADRAAPMPDSLPGHEPTTSGLLLMGKVLDKPMSDGGPETGDPKASAGEP